MYPAPTEGELYEPQEIHALIVQELTRLDEPAVIEPDGVRLQNWPSVRISIDYAAAFRPEPAVEVWSAWVDLTFMYNTDLPFTAARTHVIGFGKSPKEALAFALEHWRTAFAPPLISHIYGVLKFGADTWPVGDPRGIPGWTCMTGPYFMRGERDIRERLEPHLQAHPLMDSVRDLLAAKLDCTQPLHTVCLFKAVSGTESHADVVVNNQPFEEAGARLKTLTWPVQPIGPNLLSVRHFMICMLPGVAHREPGSPVETAPDQTRPRSNPVLFTVLLVLFTAAVSVTLYETLVRDGGWLMRLAASSGVSLSIEGWCVLTTIVGAAVSAAFLWFVHKNR